LKLLPVQSSRDLIRNNASRSMQRHTWKIVSHDIEFDSLDNQPVVDHVTKRNAVVVLAGGLGSRLGSNKALHPIAGKPMIRHVVDRVSGLAKELLVVVAKNASPNEYRGVLPDSVAVVCDELEGKTPLVGIITGLRTLRSDYAIILSCDIPFVNKYVLQLVLESAHGANASVPKWKSGRLEPLQAAYQRSEMLDKAEETFSEGKLSPTDAIRKLGKVVYVPVEEEISKIDSELTTFFNVNTKDDLAHAEMILKRGST
jgi:molybdopterin-guanine dinucleotide biosynthesis protein A